jgi:CubicO group peptidase (beta-lactamase class C family)
MPRTPTAAVFAALLLLACTGGGVARDGHGDYVPARFADPEREATLTAALPAVDSIFREYVAGARVPGAAWGVLIDGRLVHVGTAGVRDVETGAPVDSATVFRIASMTKSFTALAILRLRD